MENLEEWLVRNEPPMGGYSIEHNAHAPPPAGHARQGNGFFCDLA
jgi:hypothetical protein